MLIRKEQGGSCSCSGVLTDGWMDGACYSLRGARMITNRSCLQGYCGDQGSEHIVAGEFYPCACLLWVYVVR